ncbi:hypothetical protein SAMN04487895_101621 [Paenibacillus sophorae]|nr:hypothetical protein SAMN04487895_101621 [Paenibacillus sophorae]
MNNQNKIDPKVIKTESIEIIGDMQFYIDYGYKLYYPESIEISCFHKDKKYVVVTTNVLLGKDDYKYIVEFSAEGKFERGYSYFSYKGISDVSDQNEFKRILKKEIQKVNNLHGVAAKLLSR